MIALEVGIEHPWHQQHEPAERTHDRHFLVGQGFRGHDKDPTTLTPRRTTVFP
ncbi:hypothetical protein L083_7416 [Actinoplanes sp. N902-109]|nr:hypothetical protein L083_7416 [Actinoplanes sp. N902-109]